MRGSSPRSVIDVVSNINDDLQPLEDDLQITEDDLQAKEDDFYMKEYDQKNFISFQLQGLTESI